MFVKMPVLVRSFSKVNKRRVYRDPVSLEIQYRYSVSTVARFPRYPYPVHPNKLPSVK